MGPLEMYGYVISTVAADALALKHQIVSIYSTDSSLLIVVDQFHTKKLTFTANIIYAEIAFWKKMA